MSRDPVGSADLAGAVRSHRGPLIHYLRLLGCEAGTADDLAQDAFLVYLRKGFVGDGAALGQFLRRTARYLFLDYLRARSRWDERSMSWADQVDAAWTAEQVGRWDGPRLEALRRCEQQLVGRRAAVVRMFYAEQRSRREIAAALGMKETGVKTLLQRVRQDLRQCIEEQTS